MKKNEAPRTKASSLLKRNTEPRRRAGRMCKHQKVSEFIEICHSVAKEKGWWDEPRSEGELIALMHSELSEALEAMRNHALQDAVAEELADCCIRIFDYCGAKKIDLEKALVKKIAYNKTRPYRHGKKF